jgi:hypothetical protein
MNANSPWTIRDALSDQSTYELKELQRAAIPISWLDLVNPV